MTRTSLILVLCGLALAATSAPAAADGLPVLGVDVGHRGVTVPGAQARLVALPVPGGTLLQRVARRGGHVRRWRFLARDLTIPAVAYDATAGGLSADGRTLALVRPRRTWPQRRTTLVLADARRLSVRREVRLQGDFSFDALSPDGRRVFLVRYTAPPDPSRYEVRVLDAVTGGLAPEPVLDPTEPDEAMRGVPLSRASSPDGRWAYTLYDGAGGEPFVHALDTVGVTARCIDLPVLEGRGDLSSLRLRSAEDGRTVRVLAGRRAVVDIDSRTWDVGRPVARSAGALPSRPGSDPWWVLYVGAAIAAGVVVLRRRASRGPAPSRGR